MMAYIVLRVIWPYTRWDASLADLTHVTTWILPRSRTLSSDNTLFRLFSLISGLSDATMDQPMRIVRFSTMKPVVKRPSRRSYLRPARHRRTKWFSDRKRPCGRTR